jgi:membrane associated rhomboid family serine protease
MTLVGINVAVFVVMLANGVSLTDPDVDSLIAFGANRGTLVIFGNQWWRAFSSMFVHIGLLHLVVNMYSLWRVGGFVERMLGGPLYALVYLLAGLGGSFGSVLWNPNNVSAGASGAIVGMFGFVMGYAIQARHLLPPEAAKNLWDGILATLAINVFLAFSVPYLDNAAHAGGLLTGILAGFVGTASAIERQGRGASLGSQVIVIAAVIALGVLAKVRTENNPQVKTAEALQQAETAFRAHDLDKVEALTTEVLKKTKNPVASLLRAVARNERGDLDGGFADVNDAIIELRASDSSPLLLAEALALRAGSHQLADSFASAEADLSLAYKLRPDPAYLGLRGYSRLRIGDADGGLDDARATLANAASNSMVLNNLAWAVLVTEHDLSFALTLVNASIEKEPSAAAKSTRCWIQVARGEAELALPDCLAAVESGNELMDRGMVAFLQQQPDEALARWEEAATKSSVDARDLAPWIARARNQLVDKAGTP